MNYNLLKSAIVTTNLDLGNTTISFGSLTDLLDFNDVPVFSLDESNVLVLDIDLGMRTHIDRIEYKFSTPDATPQAVASGIGFSYKEEIFGTVYTSLATFVSSEPNVYYSTISGSVWSPRYLRVTHDVSATEGAVTLSGSLLGLQVLNEDSTVDFGADGTLESQAIESARGGGADIREIQIFNSGTTTADAIINIEPTYDAIDDCISISATSTGPWVGPLTSDLVVFNASNCDTGTYDNTELASNTLRISEWVDRDGDSSSKESLGTYLTRVFYSNSDTMLLIIDRVVPSVGRISVDEEDVTETIEFRSSNTPPMNYSVLRGVYSWRDSPSSSTYYFGFVDRWVMDNSIKESSSIYFLSTGQYTYLRNYQVVMDSNNDRWAGWLTTYGSQYYLSNAELYIFNNTNSVTYTKRLATHVTGQVDINASWRDVKLESSGGMWCWFFCQAYSDADFCDGTGYYLAHFTPQMEETFKLFSFTDDITSMDVDYDNLYCWYIKSASNTIYKIGTTGEVLVHYTDAFTDTTANLGALVVLPNQQGIWFSNDENLHRLDYYGFLLDEFTIEEVTNSPAKALALDGDGSEFLWVLEGSTLGLLHLVGDRKGTYDFQVTLNYPLKLRSVPTGCFVYCADLDDQTKSNTVFVSKVNKRVDHTYSATGVHQPGPIELTYEHENYADKLPIAIDTVWSSLQWSKVSSREFILPEALYYQARLTLRRQPAQDRYSGDSDYISSDDFVQDSPLPKPVLWGNWYNQGDNDNLSSVYVDTAANRLTLIPDGSSTNTYINTYKKFLTTASPEGDMDVRIHYILGAGNTGSASGKVERVFLYGYPMDVGRTSNLIGIRLELPSNPVGSTSYVYSSYGGGNFVSSTLGTGRLDLYEATFRIFINSSGRVYAYIAPGTSSTFSGYYYSGSYNVWQDAGTMFYWRISSYSLGSTFYVTNFETVIGTSYFYTDGPKVKSLQTQKLLELESIIPNSSKSIYFRTEVPTSAVVDSSYQKELKVRWRVPIY